MLNKLFLVGGYVIVVGVLGLFKVGMVFDFDLWMVLLGGGCLVGMFYSD